jgi:G3E family GTPase
LFLIIFEISKDKNLLFDYFNQDSKGEIERLGFVFVIDALDYSSYESVKEIFEQMCSLEKRVNLKYSKAFFINKIDLVKTEESKENLKKLIKDIKSLKESWELDSHDYYLMSALNGRGVIDAIKKFISKIHQMKSEEKQNEGLKEDIEENLDITEVYIINICKFFLNRLISKIKFNYILEKYFVEIIFSNVLLQYYLLFYNFFNFFLIYIRKKKIIKRIHYLSKIIFY